MAIPCNKILNLIRKVAPEETAAAWDNVGLLCGETEHEIGRLVLALDVTTETAQFAADEGAGLIIAHHPLIFAPLKRIDAGSSPGRELALLLENRIALYVAHTNADSSPTLSMNATIGRLLPLRDFGPVAPPVQSESLKLVVFVPHENLDQVRTSLSQAGAGEVGDYTQCSFALEGTGTFLGGEGTDPAVGQKGNLEKVQEARLEMVCPKNRLDRILTALWDTHPYEEVAYDIYPLEGYRSESHYLWKGELAEEMTLSEFATVVKVQIGEGIAPVRFAGAPDSSVRTVAWCSGCGKDLVEEVSDLGVDVYVTGDTGHHNALDALSRGLNLVDVDHYWSERYFMENVRDYLYQELGEGSDIKILITPSGPVYRPARGETT